MLFGLSNNKNYGDLKMKFKVNDKDFYKAFFTMTFTLALQNLIVFGVNLADSVMKIGRASCRERV